MKRIDYIIKVMSAMFFIGVLPSSCIYDDGSDSGPATICVNTLAVDGTRSAEGGDNTFMVLFWQQTTHLASASSEASLWLAPYLAGHAPQPVSFYKSSVFDTRFPYPVPEDTYIHATGYALSLIHI